MRFLRGFSAGSKGSEAEQCRDNEVAAGCSKEVHGVVCY